MVSTAARVGSINVLLQTTFGPAVAGLNTFATAVEGTGHRTQRAVAGIDRSVLGMNRTMAGLTTHTAGFRGLTISALRTRDSVQQLNTMLLATGALLGGLVPTLSGAYLVRMADRAQLLTNNLRTVTDGSADLKNTQEALFQVSQRTRSSFESTATIYARTARATEFLNVSQEKLLRLTETIQKSFAVGGATTAEAQGAAIQLSQGIASDRFSGEEFRSVAENAPVLLRGMAQSMGVTIGKLREMAHAGELTAKVVTEAIIDASERIDAEFAKTTSTIGQAVVYLDNAILKFVNDSQNVSAAASTISSGIRMVGDNIDVVADGLLFLASTTLAVFGGRQLSAIRNNTAAVGQNRIAVAQAAKANKEMADATAKGMRTEWIQQRLAFNRALNDGNLTAKQLERQKRSLEGTTRKYNDAVRAAALATKEHDAAMKAASLSGRAYAAAGRAASSAWAFIGGGFGAALLLAAGAFFVIQRHAAQAEADLQRFAEAGDNVTQTLARIEGRAASTGTEIERLASGFADLIRIEGFARAQAEVNRLTDDIADMGRHLQELARQVSSASGDAAVGVQITELTSRFRIGAIGAEEYAEKLQEIARANPDQSQLIADMISLALQLANAIPLLNEMDRQLDALDGREAKITITIGTRTIELTDMGVGKKGDRPKSRMEAAAEAYREAFDLAARIGIDGISNFGESKKKRSRVPRKTAEDRFDNLVQNIRDRIAAMREEQAALNLTFREQERRKVALELEQEALKHVREEARRKGEQDWQNAQLTPERIEQIKAESEAYADQAVELKKARESQEALNEVAGEFGGILRGLADGTLEWEDALLRAGQALLKFLNDMNLAQGGKGIFGGGFFQNLLGGLLGISFHSGGTVGIGGKVGPQVTGAPYAGKFHGGGNPGGRRATHKELLATVEEGETILTGGQTARTIATLSAMTDRLKDRKMEAEVLVRGVFVDDNGVVKGIARGEAATAAGRVARAVPSMVDGRLDERETRRIRPSGLA